MNTKYILIISAVAILAFGCKAKKTVTEDAEASEVAAKETTKPKAVIEADPEVTLIQAENDLQSMTKQILEAIKTGNVEELSNLIPTVAVVKEMAPKEAGSAADLEIQNTIINPLRAKMEQDLIKLIEHLNEKGVDMSNMKVYTEKTQFADPSNPIIQILSLDAGDESQYAKMAFSYVEYEGQLYMTGITTSRPVVVAAKN